MRNRETAWAPRALQTDLNGSDVVNADEAEIAPGDLSASSDTLLSPSGSSLKLCLRRARASQPPYHNIRLKTA